jgi:hypothetical protein
MSEAAAASHTPRAGWKTRIKYPRNMNSSQMPAVSDSASHDASSTREWGARRATFFGNLILLFERLARLMVATDRP